MPDQRVAFHRQVVLGGKVDDGVGRLEHPRAWTVRLERAPLHLVLGGEIGELFGSELRVDRLLSERSAENGGPRPPIDARGRGARREHDRIWNLRNLGGLAAVSVVTVMVVPSMRVPMARALS